MPYKPPLGASNATSVFSFTTTRRTIAMVVINKTSVRQTFHAVIQPGKSRVNFSRKRTDEPLVIRQALQRIKVKQPTNVSTPANVPERHEELKSLLTKSATCDATSDAVAKKNRAVYALRDDSKAAKYARETSGSLNCNVHGCTTQRSLSSVSPSSIALNVDMFICYFDSGNSSPRNSYLTYTHSGCTMESKACQVYVSVKCAPLCERTAPSVVLCYFRGETSLVKSSLQTPATREQ